MTATFQPSVDIELDGLVRNADAKQSVQCNRIKQDADLFGAKSDSAMRSRSSWEAEERAEQLLALAEKRRREEIEARNRERLNRLRESGGLLRQAEDLRALIIRVREAAISGSVGVDDATLRAWGDWASAEADRLDPIRSGQIMTHLAPAGK